MAKKSVSLFEVLPPKGKKNPEKADSSSLASQTSSSVPSSSEASESPEPQKTPERKSVDEPSFSASFSSPTAPASPTPSATASSSTNVQGELSGVSAQKREDHFWLIALIMVGFSVVIGIACYRYGYKQGIGVGYRAAVAQKEAPSKVAPSAHLSATAQRPTKVDEVKPKVPKREILPTRLALPTAEQKKAVAPPVPPKRYTLQVQTMGRNQKAATDALLAALKRSGFDAFADYSEGAVFVGRLEKSRDEKANALKKRVSRFNYHNLNFSRAYFRPIPKHLLEN